MNFDGLKKKWSRAKEERKSLAREMKRALLERGTTVFRAYGIKKVVLFGSVPMEIPSSRSDIDLFITPLHARDYWRFLADLEEAIGYPVDVYTQDDDPGFVKNIIERGKVVYEV